MTDSNTNINIGDQPPATMEINNQTEDGKNGSLINKEGDNDGDGASAEPTLSRNKLKLDFNPLPIPPTIMAASNTTPKLPKPTLIMTDLKPITIQQPNTSSSWLPQINPTTTTTTPAPATTGQQPIITNPSQQQQQPKQTIPTSSHHHLHHSTSGKLKISPDLTYDFTADDLLDCGEIGRGAYGTVNKMLHSISNTTVAVKRIRCTVDEREQKKLMMDLEVVMKSNACPFIVQFYGAVFKEGDCWICMELMDASLEQFYKYVYRKMKLRIGEDVIGKIALATVHALAYLKDELKIIHRDVKPSNILLDHNGNIKLCDFGISGQLVDSIAQSRDAGCRPYMAPERIDPSSARGYDIRSDVWSLGITLFEVSTGIFPYPKWNSIFEQLCEVVQGDPPRLLTFMNGYNYSQEYCHFINTCLIKDELQRPKYSRLLQHPFLLRSATEQVDVKSYFTHVFNSMGPNLLKRLEDLQMID